MQKRGYQKRRQMIEQNSPLALQTVDMEDSSLAAISVDKSQKTLPMKKQV
jgi:hypothetical protein